MNPADDDRYRLKSRVGAPPVLFLLGGLGAFAFAALGFVVGVLTPAEDKAAFPLYIVGTVAPSIVGFALLGRWWWLRRRVTEVVVTADGIRVVAGERATDIPWADVDRAETDRTDPGLGGQAVEVLRLYDRTGRQLAALTSELEDFDHLRRRVAKAVRSQSAAEVEDARRRPRKWQAVGYWFFAAFLAFAFVFVAYDTWYQDSHRRALAGQGVEAEAEVLRHYKFNVTPRVEYRFTDQAGEPHTRDAMVAHAAWQQLAGRPTARVRYLPSDPEYSRLADGEVEAGPSLGAPWGYLLAVVGLPLTALVAVVGYARWTGRDRVKIGPAMIKV